MMTTEKYEDALELVNDHGLGNAAVFTRSGNIAKHFTENVKIVNVPIHSGAYHSFGGGKIVV